MFNANYDPYDEINKLQLEVLDLNHNMQLVITQLQQTCEHQVLLSEQMKNISQAMVTMHKRINTLEAS
jgi:hypothetical protein